MIIHKILIHSSSEVRLTKENHSLCYFGFK